MSWIEAHQAVGRHGKTMLLARRLSIPRAQAVGHLVCMWWWAMDSCGSGGSLAKYTAETLADGAGWDDHASDALCLNPRGDALDFYSALVETGWIDHEGGMPTDSSAPLGGNSRIHDWEQYSARYFELETKRAMEREVTRARVARFREKEYAEFPCNADVTMAGNGSVTACNAPTVPTRPTIPTVPTTDTDTKAKRHAFAHPTIESVKAYCSERKNKVDPQKWLDYYTSNGWRVGRNPMKDWKAAVRTWEKNDYGNAQGGGSRGGRIVGSAAPVPGKYDHLG